MLSFTQHENESFSFLSRFLAVELKSSHAKTNHDRRKTYTKCRFLALGILHLKCYLGRFLQLVTL